MSEPDKLVYQNNLNLTWQTQADQAEKTISTERINTHLCYLYNGKYDFTTMAGSSNDKFHSSFRGCVKTTPARGF